MDLEQIMNSEYEVLKDLYQLLIDQNGYLIKREVFSLDSIVKSIEEKSREVAKWEIERRKITKGESMKEFIGKLESENLEKTYNNIVELLNKIQFQKDTNEMLIKQWLIFTNQMLLAIKPNKVAGTYNAQMKIHN